MIILNKNNKTPLYLQLYEYIKDDILAGTLTYGTKLGSIRESALKLQVSVKTVQNAYDQLLIEGYIESFERSGFYISKIETPLKNTLKVTPVKIIERNYINTGIQGNSFDHSIWKKTISKVLSDSDCLLNLARTNGETVLRKEIIKFARDSRGVEAHYNQIIIGSGTQELLSRLLELLNNPRVAYESPGYEKAERIFKYYATPIPLAISNDGISSFDLVKSNANVTYLSPSHQYPFGTIMPITKRLNMIEWANSTGSYIIEDDYNSVLRYSGNPIPSMQGLDNYGVVVYFGSFSNVLFPSINISYMILPETLLKNHEESKSTYNQTVSVLDQLTLAEFMRNGLFERHIRKIKKIYSKKSDIIQTCINNMGLTSIETSAGTHIVIEVDKEHINQIIENAKNIDILIEKISDKYVLLKYRGLSDDLIPNYMKLIFKRA